MTLQELHDLTGQMLSVRPASALTVVDVVIPQHAQNPKGDVVDMAPIHSPLDGLEDSGPSINLVGRSQYADRSDRLVAPCLRRVNP